MKYFAKFTPAITVEFNGKPFTMSRTNRYDELSKLFTALSANAPFIRNTRIDIYKEDDGHVTVYL